jgi:hypothetical protein
MVVSRGQLEDAAEQMPPPERVLNAIEGNRVAYHPSEALHHALLRQDRH